jgi:hypothetical protein
VAAHELPEIGQVVDVITVAEGHRWRSSALRYIDGGEWLWSFVTEDHISLDHPNNPDSRDEDWLVTHWKPIAPPEGQ